MNSASVALLPWLPRVSNSILGTNRTFLLKPLAFAPIPSSQCRPQADLSIDTCVPDGQRHHHQPLWQALCGHTLASTWTPYRNQDPNAWFCPKCTIPTNDETRPNWDIGSSAIRRSTIQSTILPPEYLEHRNRIHSRTKGRNGRRDASNTATAPKRVAKAIMVISVPLSFLLLPVFPPHHARSVAGKCFSSV